MRRPAGRVSKLAAHWCGCHQGTLRSCKRCRPGLRKLKGPEDMASHAGLKRGCRCAWVTAAARSAHALIALANRIPSPSRHAGDPAWREHFEALVAPPAIQPARLTDSIDGCPPATTSGGNGASACRQRLVQLTSFWPHDWRQRACPRPFATSPAWTCPAWLRLCQPTSGATS